MQRYKSTTNPAGRRQLVHPAGGRYTVAEAERSAAVRVSLTGYDNMLKPERKFSGSAILGDAYTMLTQDRRYPRRGAGAKRGGDQGPLAQC